MLRMTKNRGTGLRTTDKGKTEVLPLRGCFAIAMLRTTDKGKIEVLPLRGCFTIAMLRTTDKGKPEILRRFAPQDDKASYSHQ